MTDDVTIDHYAKLARLQKEAVLDNDPEGDMLPLLVVETEEEDPMVMGLAVGSEEFPDAIRQAKDLGPQRLVLTIDAAAQMGAERMEETGLRPLEDPLAQHGIMVVDVKKSGESAARWLPYHFEDDGTLVWDEAVSHASAEGRLADAMKEALA